MNGKLIELAERRKTLVARAAVQRMELAQALAPWRKPLAVVDHGWVAVRYVRSHPALLVGGVAFVSALSTWRRAKWVERGLLVWNLTRLARRILPSLSRGARTGRKQWRLT